MFKSDYIQALNDYRKIRQSVAIQDLLSRIFEPDKRDVLLSYDEVRNQLQAVEKSADHLQEVPLDAIVGSVGRYHDFTREFLPKSTIDESRWARVKASTMGLEGLPPIDVYRIGEAYFVKDGNHRVSVARQMGNKSIQAYVTDVQTKVTLTPETTPDDLIIKSEQIRFLETTKLDVLRPDSDLSATKAGAYPTLIEHIEVHRYFMGLEQEREISFPEASALWYDQVFQPVVGIIRNRSLLRDFPDRTEVDLYLWAADRRAELKEEIGWDIGPESALIDLVEKNKPKPFPSILSKLVRSITDLVPNELQIGPPPGTWRQKLTQMTKLEFIFNHLIVALDDSPNSWYALDLAIKIAHLEQSHIHGIHIQPSKDEQNHHQIETTFNSRCSQSNLQVFDYQLISGDIDTALCESARYGDLLLLPLNHPPDDKPISRLSSGLAAIIRSCPTPVLTVPGPQIGLETILLAFDGSLQAVEAMFISAYFGTQFSSNLIVLTSSDSFSGAKQALQQAETYISQFPIRADYVLTKSSILEAILEIQSQGELDLILMGGYGGNVIRDLVVGSVVDQVLREIKLPVLICR
jgi:nucleotide-binding universal stress UspA family protein